ncbi:MAG TPA: hypothetical protein VF131_20415 [Blastocatellia bacterium]|nr:hypothetical protein [Blastocatellia bacterium]
MASLQARSSLRSAHPLFLINKLISLAAFIVLLGAGWIAVCYLKNEFANRRPASSDQHSAIASVSTNETATRVGQSDSVEVKRLAKPVKLVYACSSDRVFYHASSHLPARCDRSALSEDAAFERGLKACSVCMPVD